MDSCCTSGLNTELFSSLPLGLVMLDRDGCVSRQNPAAEVITGPIPPGALWSNVVQRLFHYREGDGHEVSTDDGRHVHVSTCPLPQKNGQMVILQDLTATRKLQEAISRQQRLDHMGHMLAAIAHQLRTPLTTAMLQTGNLEWLLQDTLPASGQQALQVLEQQLETLEQKISDLLLFARGTQDLHDQLTTEQFLEELQLYCSNELWSRLALSWQIADHSDQGRLRCNRNSLLSAFGNLIKNALEAGADSATLGFLATPQQLTLSLSDNGPGLNNQPASQLLEPFFSTKTTGTGLGLPIVRIVAELHGGAIALNPAPEGGLQVVISLPLQPPYPPLNNGVQDG